MVGVCLTVIGILRVITTVKPLQTLGDDLLALDALCFLASTLLSYAALKMHKGARRRWLEQIADILFLSALSVMALVCFLIVYALTEK